MAHCDRRRIKANGFAGGFLEGRPNNEYERVWVKDSRQNIEGFVYVYSLEKAQHLPIIYSNSWREHRRNQK